MKKSSLNSFCNQMKKRIVPCGLYSNRQLLQKCCLLMMLSLNPYDIFEKLLFF